MGALGALRVGATLPGMGRVASDMNYGFGCWERRAPHRSDLSTMQPMINFYVLIVARGPLG